MNLCDDGGTFADRGGDPLGRAGTHVSDGKDAWTTGFERQPLTVTGALSREDEARSVERHTAVEPVRIGIGTDEQEEVARRALPDRTSPAVPKRRPGQACRPVAVQIGNLAAHMQFDIGQRRDPIDQVPGHGLLEGAAHHQVQMP